MMPILTTSTEGGDPIDVTAAEAARRLDVTRAATSKWAAEGKFPGAWLDTYNRAWHIPAESVEAMRMERERSRATDTTDGEAA